MPASLTLVSKKDIGTVVPSEPASHAVSKVEDIASGFLMDPVSHRAFKVVGVSADLLRELFLEAGEHIVERKSVC